MHKFIHSPHYPSCLLVTGIFPPDIGGPASFVPQISRALIDRGLSCRVITLSDRVDNGGQQYPFPVRRIYRKQNLLLRFMKTCWQIVLAARSADVVFANGLYLEAAVGSLLAGKPLLIKIVGDEVWERASYRGWTSEDLKSFQTSGGDWKIALLRLCRRFALACAARIVVPSEFTKNLVKKWAKNLPLIEVIPNAVEKPDNCAPYELPDHWSGLLKLVTVGRLIPLKCIEQIIECMGSLQSCALVIVGDGPERNKLIKRTQQLSIQDRVLFTGPLPSKMVQSVLKSCDIFVLNSTVENFPHVILEAMAADLPVVATRVGGVREIVSDGENGFLIEPNDPIALQEAIQRLLIDRKKRNRIRERGRQTVTRFSWELIADQFSELLVEICRAQP